MSNIGVGPSGLFLSSDGDKLAWASGGGLATLPDTISSEVIIVESLTVTSGATFPAFDTLAVSSPLASGAGSIVDLPSLPTGGTTLSASGWIQIKAGGTTAYIPIWV